MLRLAAASMLVFVAACAGTSRDKSLEVNDTGVIPVMRVAIMPGSAEPPSQPRSGFAFELGLSKVSGSSTQSLPAGERVNVDGAAITGPAQLANDADARFIDALVRFRAGGSVESRLGLELLAGLSQANLSFRAGSLSKSQSAVQLAFGIGGLVRLGPNSMLHARYTSGVNGDPDELKASRLELAFVQSFARNFAVRAGYGLWNVVRTPPAPGSEMRMRVSGPMLGLDLSF